MTTNTPPRAHIVHDKVSTHLLKYEKSTKGSHVYNNATFPAVYIPKTLVADLSEDGSIPTFLKMTLECEGVSTRP